jgi:predicted RNA methylase
MWARIPQRKGTRREMNRRQPIPLLFNRVAERWWEWRLGIHSTGDYTSNQLKLRNDGIPYDPIPFRAFFRAMEHVPKELLHGSFVDYGAGKGRALVLAARYYPFRQVLGVEMSSELCSHAEGNLRRAGAKNATVVCCDAANYVPPSDTTVFFMYNPFFGETMRKVLDNLRKSLQENPRVTAIVVCRARNFLAATLGQNWLEELACGTMLLEFNWHVFLTVMDRSREHEHESGFGL